MSPSIVMGLLLGSIYGLLWHACLGRRWLWLPLYWLSGLLGFLGGCILAVLGNIQFLRLGTLPLVEGTVGAFLALAATWWIAGRRRARPVLSKG